MNIHTWLKLADCFPNCSCESSDNAWGNLSIAFWTSTFYFLAALGVYKKIKVRSFESEFWTFICINLSISSMLFHSFYIQSTLALDYASITMALSFFTLFPLVKRVFKRKILVEWTFIILFLLLWMLFMLLDKQSRIILCLTIFILSLPEVANKLGRHPLRSRRFLYISCALILISFACFLLEELKIWCDPSHWVQGHTFWHVGSALGLYLYGRWRFEV